MSLIKLHIIHQQNYRDLITLSKFFSKSKMIAIYSNIIKIVCNCFYIFRINLPKYLINILIAKQYKCNFLKQPLNVCSLQSFKIIVTSLVSYYYSNKFYKTLYILILANKYKRNYNLVQKISNSKNNFNIKKESFLNN